MPFGRLNLGTGLGHGPAPAAAGGGGTAPSNTVLPAITGTPTSGQTLSVSDGTWTGDAPITYAYQWKADGTAISGATGSTYTLTDSEIGKAITCTVTATNAAGTASATSAATDAVAAAASPVALAATSHFNGFGSPVTGSAKAIGDAAADRITLITVAWEQFSGTRTLDSVTVGGVSASRLVRYVDAANSNNAEIWAVASGSSSSLSASTSANIVLTWNTGNQSVTCQIYSLTGSSITPSSTATGTVSVSITVPTNGGAVAVCYNDNTVAASLSGVTEDYNANDSTGGNMRGIHGHSSTAGSLTATFSGTSSATKILAAAFGPV